MDIVVGRVVRISKRFLEKEGIDVAAVRAELTIKGTKASDFGSRDPLVTFEERRDFIYVPKVYGITLAKASGFPFSRVDHPGETIAVTFSGQLRQSQVQAVEDTIRTLREKEGAVMNMYCGFGKTTCCNFVTCRLGLKTLILVHSSSLVQQWKERIEQFVRGAKVGLIRQKTFDVQGNTHVIGLMQSICKRDYGKDAFRSFGLTVIDECHHVCAENLSRCLRKAGSRYRLGLSATPFRKDGFTPFLFQAVGEIACTVQRDESTQDMDVHAVQLETGPEQVHYVHRAGKKSINIARMITDICEHAARNAVVVRAVHTHALAGRQVMVLSDRRAHLNGLHASVTAVANASYTTSFMVGGIDADAMRLAEGAAVIFATYAYASEGVDVPSLDTVVFATPRVDIVQTTGRILRKHDKKQKPLVIDFVDKFSLFKNQFSKRRRYYKKLGADVTNMDQQLRANADSKDLQPPPKKPKFAFVIAH